MNFESLVGHINQVQDVLQSQAAHAVNLALTARNWLVGYYIDRFRHEYASQLNLYLNYYKHEVMQEDDNPPIGLLLCTDYGETTVRYATEGLSQNLFVSKYRLQLPTEEEIRQYLIDNISEEDFRALKEEIPK